MLRVDLRALAAGPLETHAVVQPDDPGLADLEFTPTEPVRVSGRIMASGPGSFYWEGRLQTRVRAACRRCLVPVDVAIDEAVDLLFTEDQGADDPSAMIIPPRATELDLGDAIRGELILAAPEFTLCRDDCRGICPRCGADLNEGPCTCPSEGDPRWAALEALKGRAGDEKR
jgi:uncharacterized protein